MGLETTGEKSSESAWVTSVPKRRPLFPPGGRADPVHVPLEVAQRKSNDPLQVQRHFFAPPGAKEFLRHLKTFSFLFSQVVVRNGLVQHRVP